MRIIMVTTKSGSHYHFSKDIDGKWHLMRHTSEYVLTDSVMVRQWREMRIIAIKLSAFSFEPEGDEMLLTSSPVQEIVVDGKTLKGFKAWKGITIG